MDDVDTRGVSAGKVAIGFIVLTILLGPVASYTAASFQTAVQWQVLAGGAVASSIAGCVLLLGGLLGGEQIPNARQGLAICALLAPRVLDEMLGYGALRMWVHETGWGVALLIAVGAPAWLGLLAALRMVAVEVPRVLVAAGIAGVGAVLLVIPVDAYAIAAGQIPMLGMRLLLGMATVLAWWFAQRTLMGEAALPTAGLFLLMSAGVSGVSSLLVERVAWQPVDWREAAVPVLVQAGVAAAACWLWFYLLGRMRLTGFCMHPLAVWVATLGVELVGARFAAWRLDVAVVLAVGAIVVGMGARIADEQPTVLGLRET